MVTWSQPAEDASQGSIIWLAAWKSGPIVYAYIGETTATESAAAMQAEMAQVAEELTTWQAR